jgi:hypothetical protein
MKIQLKDYPVIRWRNNPSFISIPSVVMSIKKGPFLTLLKFIRPLAVMCITEYLSGTSGQNHVQFALFEKVRSDLLVDCQ